MDRATTPDEVKLSCHYSRPVGNPKALTPVPRAAKESTAVIEQFCQTNGQLLLPIIVNLIESASQVVLENLLSRNRGEAGLGCVLDRDFDMPPQTLMPAGVFRQIRAVSAD